MSKKKISKKVKAVEDEQPTRRMSDTILMRMLDDHMQESISEIADIYQRLCSLMGMKFMKFEERTAVQTSRNADTGSQAVELANRIASWRKQCDRRRFKSQVVMDIVTDGCSIANVMRRMKLKRACVQAHLRACLTLWSIGRKRAGPQELKFTTSQISVCCAKPQKS